ncbi:MAG: DNA double-strand break repair nuclease NurA [Ignisphaera sp.]|nr:DNA double-strand break repair nuclease NurA [Ignisphaera sp.]MCX8167414.1 DNA double-strand break repair nuclease NurA [Ignisphaera sp.]MDW8085930.1 DNA double-strand break repair nuclease NurA [Ignisphaera sp.]
MTALFQELESVISKLLNTINRKIELEKVGIIKMLDGLNWVTKFKNDVDKCTAIGVDSGFTIVETRIGVIYVIQGVAVKQTFNKSLIKIDDYHRFYDVGLIFIKPKNSSRVVRRSAYKRVLSNYAYLLELQSVRNLLAGSASVDIVLLDGSLLSFLVQKEFRGISVIVSSVGRGTDIEIKDLLKKKTELVNEIARTSHTVFVAKSSNAGFYTNGAYPDIYVFELAKLFRIEPYYRTGYSSPLVIEIDKTLKRFLGMVNSYDIQYFTITYSRFIDNAPIFQLTLPYKADADTVGDIFSYVRALSPSGYPMTLEYPHRISKLSRSTVIDIFIRLGIPVVSGRELIEL